MEKLTRAIESTRKGDVDAFRPIVERFQNMAVGYAWSILGDAQLAEDAAQEAFLNLDALREPAALPAWLRRIVRSIAGRGFDDTSEPEGSYFRGAGLLHCLAGCQSYPVPENAVEVARTLLNAGADPNAATDVGITPLALVVSCSVPRESGVMQGLLEVLIESGADVHANAEMPIYNALIHGETEAAATLHVHGAGVDLRSAAGLGLVDDMAMFFTADRTLETDARRGNARPYFERRITGAKAESSPEPMTAAEILVEALAFAVINRQQEAARFLLERGADINGMPARLHGGGQTPLHLACTSMARATRTMVAFLLEQGADAARLDEAGVRATPPQWAVHNGLPECVSAFLARTAIDAQDHLRHAVTQAQEANPRRRDRRLEVVRLLIEAGADPSQPGADGWTAAEAAQSAEDSELTAILIMRQVKGT